VRANLVSQVNATVVKAQKAEASAKKASRAAIAHRNAQVKKKNEGKEDTWKNASGLNMLDE
jgi:hypothetical protein